MADERSLYAVTKRIIADERATSCIGRQIKHNTDLVSGLRLLREETSLCDVTIVVGTRRFQAHRVVLSAASCYFKAMFTSGFKESSNAEVTIDGDGEVFGSLLSFVYSGELCLSTDTIIEVIRMSCYLQLPNALSVCSDYLNEHYPKAEISIDIALQVSAIASAHHLQDIEKSANYFLARNFGKFSATQVFLNDVDVDVLAMFLDRSDLTTLSAMNEEQVLRVVTTWLEHDWSNRQVHGRRLLNKVHLDKIPVAKLKKHINARIRSVPECKELFQATLANKCKKDAPDSSARGVKLLLGRGVYSKATMHYYNSQSNKWEELNNFSDPGIFTESRGNVVSVAFPERLVSCGDRLFMASTGGKFSVYDAGKNIWKPLPNMKRWYRPATMVCLNGILYALSYPSTGDHDQQELQVCNMKTKRWQMLPAMPTPASTSRFLPPVAVGYQGKILVYMYSAVTASTWELFMYNPSTQTWFRLDGNEVQDFAVSLAVVNGKCYRILHINDYAKDYEISVHELVCSLDGDHPTVSLGEVQDQRKLNYIEYPCHDLIVFTIDEGLYVNLDNECTYKLMERLNDDISDDECLKITEVLEGMQAFRLSHDRRVMFAEHKFEKLHHDVSSTNSL